MAVIFKFQMSLVEEYKRFSTQTGNEQYEVWLDSGSVTSELA